MKYISAFQSCMHACMHACMYACIYTCIAHMHAGMHAAYHQLNQILAFRLKKDNLLKFYYGLYRIDNVFDSTITIIQNSDHGMQIATHLILHHNHSN